MFMYHAPYELTRGTPGSIGLDLRAMVGEPREIAPGQRWKCPTGVHVAIPRGYGGFVMGRSGLAINHGITVATGVIDQDYRGEIAAILFNHGSQSHLLVPGERIAQLVIQVVDASYAEMYGDGPLDQWERVDSVADLGDTTRGSSGFGSTGR